MHVVKRLADFMMGDIWNSLDGFCIFREVRSFKKKKPKDICLHNAHYKQKLCKRLDPEGKRVTTP